MVAVHMCGMFPLLIRNGRALDPDSKGSVHQAIFNVHLDRYWNRQYKVYNALLSLKLDFFSVARHTCYHRTKITQIITQLRHHTHSETTMLLSTAVAAFAAFVFGAPVSNDNDNANSTAVPYNTSIPLKGLDPLAPRWRGNIKDCHQLCVRFRNRNNCVQDNWRINCEQACIDRCFVLGSSDTDSPSTSDLVVYESHSDHWHRPKRIVTTESDSTDRVTHPCYWCKRSDDGSVTPPDMATVDATVQTMLRNVAAYGKTYWRISEIPDKRLWVPYYTPIGTRLDNVLRDWVAGVRNSTADLEESNPLTDDRLESTNPLVADLRYPRLYEAQYRVLEDRVKDSKLASPLFWANRLAIVANKDTEDALDVFNLGLPVKQRLAIGKQVHQGWKQAFAETQPKADAQA